MIKRMALLVATLCVVLAGCAPSSEPARASHTIGLAVIPDDLGCQKTVIAPTEQDQQEATTHLFRAPERYSETGEDILWEWERLPDLDAVSAYKKDLASSANQSHLICLARVEERAVYTPADPSALSMTICTMRITQVIDQEHYDVARHYNEGDCFSFFEFREQSTANYRPLAQGEEYYLRVSTLPITKAEKQAVEEGLQAAFFVREAPIRLTRYGKRVTDDVDEVIRINGLSEFMRQYLHLVVDRHIKHLY